MKDVMILAGAGQIGMAIARRMGYGKKIVIGDKKLENAKAVTKTMEDASFDERQRRFYHWCGFSHRWRRHCIVLLWSIKGRGETKPSA